MARTADQDTIIRIALASMAADKASPLNHGQRQWIIALAGRTTPLADTERATFRASLLEWVASRQPRILDIVQAQFTEN